MFRSASGSDDKNGFVIQNGNLILSGFYGIRKGPPVLDGL